MKEEFHRSWRVAQSSPSKDLFFREIQELGDSPSDRRFVVPGEPFGHYNDRSEESS